MEITSEIMFEIIGRQTVELTVLKNINESQSKKIEALEKEVKSLKDNQKETV